MPVDVRRNHCQHGWNFKFKKKLVTLVTCAPMRVVGISFQARVTLRFIVG